MLQGYPLSISNLQLAWKSFKINGVNKGVVIDIGVDSLNENEKKKICGKVKIYDNL